MSILLEHTKIRDQKLMEVSSYLSKISKFTHDNKCRKHVFSDLKPYLCTFRECNSEMFESRKEWFRHEHQTHRTEWLCPFCADVAYRSETSFCKHLGDRHGRLFTNDHLPLLVKTCCFPISKFSPHDCPFCDDWSVRLKKANSQLSDDDLAITPLQFERHVGSHLEQLALFALPRGDGQSEDEDESVSETAEPESDAYLNTGSQTHDLYSEIEKPRLHDGNALLAFAETAQDIGSALTKFLDSVTDYSPDITALIAQCFAVSSALRGLHDTMNKFFYPLRHQRISDDLLTLRNSLIHTFKDIQQILGRLGGSSLIIRTGYYQVWEELDSHFYQESGNTLKRRLEYYQEFIRGLTDTLIEGHLNSDLRY